MKAKYSYMVLSRFHAVQYAKEQQDKTSIVISIYSTDDKAAPIQPSAENNILAVLPIGFNDVEKGTGVITRKDADKIARFVNEHKNNVERIVVHCDAGISRSAGVCAAIMKHLSGSDDAIFKSERFVPNMQCYRTTLEAFNKQKGA